MKLKECLEIYVWCTILASPLAAQKPVPAPDLILHNGHIYTANAARPWVEAISITGDRIVAVGSDAEITPTADAHSRVIDLHGHMAMPGINDAHNHVGGAPYGVEARTQPPLMADPSIQEVSEAVQKSASSAPPGDWIHAGVGVSIIRHPQKARAAIDKAGAGHPVLLDARWGHGLILNTEGLKRLGIDDAVKDPQGGHFDRTPDGHLTGLAGEYAGNAIKRRLVTEAGVPASVAAFGAYAKRRLAEGVTTVQIMGTNETLDEYRQTLVQADVPLRIRLIRFPMPDEDRRVGQTYNSGEETLTPLIRISGVKWLMDGTPLEELATRRRSTRIALAGEADRTLAARLSINN